MKRLSTALVSLSILASGAPAALAHGGGDHFAFGHAGVATDVTQTIKISASDYEFSPTELTIKAGATVRFVVSNTSTHMHEFTVGDADAIAAHRKSMSDMADMHHMEGEHPMPSNSVHVAPGKTGELIWTFEGTGPLAFACNYPGHADLGMEGKITVK